MALAELSQDKMQASPLEQDRESRGSSLEPLEGASETSSLEAPPEGAAIAVPSFIQAADGGLVCGSLVPANTVFGPYGGSIRKVSSSDEEEAGKESGSIKFCSSSKQAFMIDVDRTESWPPWWMCIKQTTVHRNANIALISHGGAVYLKTLRQIPKSAELQMILAVPPDNVDSDAVDKPTTPPGSDTTHTTSLSQLGKASTTSTEGPPFKCSFCCIEFRNPSNLEAHRVYYCPGTATEPLPSSRRRSTMTTNHSATTHKHSTAVKSTPPLKAKFPDTLDDANDAPEETIKTFVCQLCQSSFECRSNCESHMLLLHCDEAAHLCKFCNFISRDRQGLCHHVFSHVKEMLQERRKGSGDDKNIADTERKLVDGGREEDDGDEKENRYETVIMCRNTGSRLQLDRANSASSPRHKRLTSSPSNPRSRPSSNPVIPSHALPKSNPSPVLKEERCGSATPVREHSWDVGDDLCSVSIRLKREPQEENILSCLQCDFVTSRQSSLQKHMSHHNDPKEKAQDMYVSMDSQPSRDSQARISDERVDLPTDTKCHECNIVFISRKNYAAHKQYYCASRHANSASPPSTQDSDVNSVSNGKESPCRIAQMNNARMDRHSAKRTPPVMNDTVKPNEPSTLKAAAISQSSPYDFDDTDIINSQINGSLATTSRLNLTSPSPLSHTPVSSPSKSSSDGRPSFEQPLRMIPLEGGGRPQFLPPGAMLHGPQLVLVTPVVFPQSSSTQVDSNLRIPVICTLARGEQPLDLSTKPKTPPLSDIPEPGTHKVIISTSSIKPSPKVCGTFPERQSSNRCKECEITFSKKESLVVHKEYYCAGRHVFTPRTVVRTKQHGTATKVPNQNHHIKSPSPSSLVYGSPVETSFSESCHIGSSRLETSEHLGCDKTPSPQLSMHPASYSLLSQHTADSAGRMPSSQISPGGKKNIVCAINNREELSRHKSWSPKLKRAAMGGSSAVDNDWSLPPIKRKKNLVHVDTETSVSTTSSSSPLTNGVIVKQEPSDSDSTINSNGYEYSPTCQTANKQSLPSTLSPIPHSRSPPGEMETDIKIKHEPEESNLESNRYCPVPNPAAPTSSSKVHHRELRMDSANKSRFPARPPVMIHSVTPLSIPVYKHPSTRQAPSSTAHITVNSYLTGSSRPLLRGLKPTVKHCRNCNISFSSLSTFIAHKKYYCASHHQAKDAAT